MLLPCGDVPNHSQQTFKPRILSIHLSGRAELSIASLQVGNHRLKPDDLNVAVPRKELSNLPPELDELEFAAERLKVDCVFHRRQKQPEMGFQSTRANLIQLLQQL
jgi:hypothetical protein